MILCGIPIVKKFIFQIDKSRKIEIFKQDGGNLKNTKIYCEKIKSILKLKEFY